MKNCITLWSTFLVIAGLALGQSTTGRLTGRVLDPSGATVSEAKIKLTNVASQTSVAGETDSAGMFVLPNLPPATYRLEVTKPGFKTLVKPDIVLNVQDNVSIEVSLTLGSPTESVTVEAGVPPINTESAAVSTVIDRQFVNNIPLNGRTLQSLITLTPGIVLTGPQFGDSGQFSVNGQRPDANYFSVDGVSANAGVDGTLAQRTSGGSVPGFSAQGTTSNLISIDAVQEFRIQTSTFAPEFGRTPGAQVSIVTRSGNNQFHGALFEYFRNDKLDANNWFANRNGLKRPQQRMNDFGGVLGGPVIKDKTFFFFSYEGLRVRQPVTLETLVPDVASRQRAPNPAIAAMLNTFPLPTRPGTPDQVIAGIAPANATLSNPSTLNATSLRLDHNLGSRWRLFARYNYAPSSVITRGGGAPGQGEPLNYEGLGRTRTTTATAGANTVVTPRMANELLFNYTRNNVWSISNLSNFGGATPPSLSQLIPPSSGVTIPQDDIAFEANIIGVGLFDLGPASRPIQQQWNIVDNFSWIAGRHQLKFGFDYRRLNPTTRPPQYLQIPVFFGVATSPIGAFNVLSGTALQGIVVSNQSVSLRFDNYSTYLQDTWAVTPRLTLTYGIRWDVNPAPSTTGRDPIFTFVDPFQVANLVPAPGRDLYRTTYGNVAPRIGVAYTLRNTSNWQTVLRGGYGIFFDLGNNNAAAVGTSFPFLRLKAPSPAPFPYPPSIAAPVPLSTNPPYGQLAATDPNLVLPRTHQWNFSVEQALGANQSLSVSYVGAAGRELLRNVTLRSTPNVPNGILIFTNGATSDYNGLQIQYRRRLSNGLQVLASHTWSHSIDTQSFNNGSNIAPDAAFITTQERGSSAFDARHVFSLALTYDVPKTNFGWFSKIVLNDWAVNSVIAARTATPVDLSFGSIPGPGGSSISQRPNVVPGQPFFLDDPNVPGGRRLNRAAFARPAAGTIGNLGRNTLRGFSAFQADLSLRREFPIWEKVRLQFRAEFFNILNRPNFANFNQNLNNPLFGISPATLATSLSGGGGLSQLFQFGGPRSAQLALRLTF